MSVLCIAGSVDAKPVHSTFASVTGRSLSVNLQTSFKPLAVETVTISNNAAPLDAVTVPIEQLIATSDRVVPSYFNVERPFALSKRNTFLAVNATADLEQGLSAKQAHDNYCKPERECLGASQRLAQLQRGYPTTPYPPTRSTLPIPSLPAAPATALPPPPPTYPVGAPNYAPTGFSPTPPPNYSPSYPIYPSGVPPGYPIGSMPPSYGYPMNVPSGYSAGSMQPNYPSGAATAYPAGYPMAVPGYPPGYPTNVPPGYPIGSMPPSYGYPMNVPSGYPAGSMQPNYPSGAATAYPAGYPVAVPGYPSSYPMSYPVGYPAGFPASSPASYPNSYPVGGSAPYYPSGYPAGAVLSPNNSSAAPGAYPAGYPTSYPMTPPGYPPGYPTNYPAGYPASPPSGYPASAFPPPPNYPAGFPSPNAPIAPSRSPDTQVQSTDRNQPDFSPHATRSRSAAFNAPSLQVQGVYVYQGDESSARARLNGTYPLTPRLLFGTTLDVTTGKAFTDTPEQGFNINELYLATSFPGLPSLRFAVGQLDLTSYFDRNSFAKDGASQFFNPVFQTNPALSATGIGSRPSLLANWRVTDSIEAKAAVFSSARNIGDFALDGFAGEVGLRYGNAIIRGTYVADRDGGRRDGFQELFQLDRGGGRTGPLRSDREEAYGVNAEVFIPQLNMGLFARYGHQDNIDLGKGGDTYSGGISFLDLFTPGDRLGLAYGRGLSNDNLRRQSGNAVPDVLELFYDFRLLPNLKLGFTIQERNGFSETIAGFRLRTEFDVTPSGRPVQ